jgi:cyclopropane-fatty-acyl-phospholipid synthase
MMSKLVSTFIRWAELGRVPDGLVRAGIRALLRERLSELPLGSAGDAQASTRSFVAKMDQGPIALVPRKANEQHYEVPAAFFAGVLGPRHKYSACHWADDKQSLEQAELDSIAETCRRAGLRDGMRVLELGCGWGSISLWAAENYPNSEFLAVSNSGSQRAHIEAEATRRSLHNLRVITCDMNDFATDERFDRVISIEMFEHMRNHRLLFERIHGWLVPGGRFFMHIFCHRDVPYAFEDRGPGDWMTRHFFSGGMMPSDDLPLRFQDRLKLVDRWRWNGRHYERTLNAWLANMDRNRGALFPLIERTYGKAAAPVWWGRWRIFFMACAELFGFDDGEQWWVSHYLFERPSMAAGS